MAERAGDAAHGDEVFAAVTVDAPGPRGEGDKAGGPAELKRGGRAAVRDVFLERELGADSREGDGLLRAARLDDAVANESEGEHDAAQDGEEWRHLAEEEEYKEGAQRDLEQQDERHLRRGDLQRRGVVSICIVHYSQVQGRAANRLYYFSAKILQSVEGPHLYLTGWGWGVAPGGAAHQWLICFIFIMIIL